MDEYKDSTTSLIADVDCTTDGKDLCEKHGVRGYPTIKWGSPDELKDYSGGRSLSDLQKFAAENLGPQCGPGENIGLCDADTKTKIETYVKMSEGKLEGKIRNTVKQYEVEMPIMKKVLAYLKANPGKTDL